MAQHAHVWPVSYTPPRPQRGSWFGLLLFWALAAAIVFGVLVWRLETIYEGRIYPGVSVAGVPVGGLSPDAAAVLLRQRLHEQTSRPVVLRAAGQAWVYTLEELGYMLDVEASVEQAYAVGRDVPAWLRPLAWWLTLRSGHEVTPVYRHEPRASLAVLSHLAREINRDPQDAQVVVVGLDAYARPATFGRTLDIEASLERIQQAVAQGSEEPVELVVRERPPRILSAEAPAARVQRLLSAPLRLEARLPVWVETAEGPQRMEWPLVWAVNRARQARLVRLVPAEQPDGQLGWKLNVDPAPLQAELEVLAARLAQPPREARFDYDPETDTLRPLIVSQPGIEVDVEGAQHALEAALQADASPTALALPVQVTKPAVSTADAEKLNIHGVAAVGESAFGGSPPGREQNIDVASSRFHGIVIPPHTEFSFNAYLGEVLDATGYEESYIILGNRTQVGIGGGVCQVSTTLFRAAFFAGFEITERYAHGYRVSYYEPPVGMDATIFSPYVDFKFRNDTDNYYLLERELDLTAKRLRFIFYGPDTGRSVEMVGPQIIEVIPHGEPIYEEDPSLPAGVVKQVDWARDGAKVKVERLVRDKATGEVIRHDVFWSNYRPWVARYLVGIGPASETVAPEGEGER